jgi:LysM repeat protein
LIEQLGKGHIVSVLIDEAQNLSIEVLEGLRLLSNLETDKEKLLQIVLMGQPELERKLNQPSLRQLKQRVAHHCQLAPLKENEVGPYIDLRLRAAGYGGEDLFGPDAVGQIALYSTGIPRLINIICDNALLNAYGTSQKRVTREMIHEVARDLRLEAQPEVVNVTVPAMQAPATDAKQGAPRTTQPHRLQSPPSNRTSRVRRGILFALLLLVIVTASSENVIPNLNNFVADLFEDPNSKARLEPSVPRSLETIDKAKVAMKNLQPTEERREVTINLERNPSPISPRRAAGKEYTIKANDTLSGLAERYYGSQWRWQEIYAANRESIKNPDYIYIGQKITLPAN